MKDFMKRAQEAADKIMTVAEEKMGQAKSFFDDVTEVARLEWQLSNKKRLFDGLLFEYGKLCYNAEADKDEVTACYNALVESEAEICALEAQIKEIKEEEAKKAAEKEAEKSTIFCTNCGKEYKNSEKFCSKCGNKLKK